MRLWRRFDATRAARLLALTLAVGAAERAAHAQSGDSSETESPPVAPGVAQAPEDESDEPASSSSPQAGDPEEVVSPGTPVLPPGASSTPAQPPPEPVALPSGADKSGVTSKTISVPSGSGTVQGMGESFSAQLSTGIATFSIPIALPAARGAAQPSLGLSYSSSGGFGVAGVGWQIGVPFIARQTDRGVPKYKDKSSWDPEQDRFVFNGGQELVPICTVAGASCAGALATEAMPVWANGWQYFRPRVEGLFLRFFWSADHLTWRVQDKSGVTMELGVPLDGTKSANALERNPDKLSEIYRWHLARQYDTYGDANPASGYPAPYNVVVYRYLQDGGAAYLSDIYDTPPESGAATAPLSQYAHHTRLSYEARTDPTSSYRTGWRVEQRLRLARIDVASKTGDGLATGSRKLARRYHLTYAKAWHGSLLESVQVEGRCGGAEGDSTIPEEDGSEGFPASTGCARLPAMKLGYSHVTPYTASGATGIADLAGYEGFDERVIGIKQSPPHSLDEELSDLFDVDADGLPDLLVSAAGVYGAGHGVFFNGAAGEANAFGAVVKMGVNGVLGADAGTISLKNLNVVPLDLDGDGTSDLLHMPMVKTYAVYSAVQSGNSWAWQGRAVATPDGLSPKIDLGKDALDTQVVDVDFDGLVDVVVTTGTEVQTYFALGRYPGGDGRFGQAKPTSPTTATLSSEPVRACVPWSATPVRFSDPDIKLADMNGDGIVDIVRIHQGDLRYWPGRGNGFWGTGKRDDCPSGTFGSNRHIAMETSPNYSDIQGQGLRLDDVNGDGLSDLIQIRFNEVDVWLNVDGKGWTERHIIKGTPETPSFMNRVRLVDVNGSGTRDVLWGTAGAYKYMDLAGGSRPSVLTKVENGLGKTTTLSYSTSSAEMLAAAKAGKPWTSRMPTVTHVVKTVVETNNLSLAASGVKQRTTEYSYADPVFDGRQREFRGFRKATAKRIGDANSPTDITDTTFLLGQCADEDAADGIPACAVSERWRDNPREALKGLPLVTERRDENGVYLSTERTVYKLRRLYTGLDGRQVRHAFEYEKHTALYDTASFSPASYTADPGPVGLIVEPNLSGIANIEETFPITYRAANPAYVARRSLVDLFGNQTDAIAFGCTGNCPSGASDETITTHTEPTRPENDPTGWLWRTGSSYVSGSVYFLGQLNQTSISYSVKGAPLTTTVTLASTLALDRFHETTGASVAGAPAGASSNGSITVSSNTYDDFGNVTRETGPNSRCRDLTYDGIYKQLPTAETIFLAGCGGSSLATGAAYDRAFGQVNVVHDPNNQNTHVAYDAFGRLSSITRPRPDGGSGTTPPSVKLSYFLPPELGTPSAPAHHSIVKTQTQDATSVDTESYQESWSYVDGFGQTLATIAEADTSAGDDAAWIVSGRVTYDAKGALEKKYLDTFYSGSPNAFDFQAASTQPAGSQSYDAFGRQRLTRDLDGTITLESFYHALSTDLWDAADREDTTHIETFATEKKDGHGRTATTVERFKEGATVKQRETTTVYLPTGQPQKITRKLGGSSTEVVRWMRYDSLGRMVLNVEPNTSVNYTSDPTALPSNLKAWRYAYNDAGDLVGTSDARGCGVNFTYDGAGRLLLEDYSPCEASHAAYSEPNLTSRTGIEVQYVYDSGPSDAPASFFDDCASAGRLVAVYDRASASMSCHDARGRVTASAARVAKPGTPDEDLDSRYAPRWYARVFVFDSADRERAATTGATNSNLQGATETTFTGATNAVTTQYSARGTVKSVGGSHGTLVSSIARTADGLIEQLIRGDLAQTTTAYTYDDRRRVERVFTDRDPPSEWASPPSNYLPAPSYPSNHQPSYQLILQDDNFDYDIVGNPTLITDSRVADEWPAGAKPVTRLADYDDLYRLVSIQYQYAASDDTWISPFDAENSGTPSLQDPRRAKPSPHVSFDKRLLTQSFAYDWLGNTSATDDDADGFYDRSLGTVTNGAVTGTDPKPYQLLGADNTATSSTRSGTLAAAYDTAGNLKRLQVNRNGPCLPSAAKCKQVFAYRWDEVGRLADARRWDLAKLKSMSDPLPSGTPNAHLRYAYDAGDQRVLKTAIDSSLNERHTVYVFETLELRRAAWLTSGTPDYDLTEWTEVAFLSANGVRLARLAWDETDVPTLAGGQLHVLLELGDHLGSTSVVIDKASGELVERGTYQAYGGAESDYRPGRWKGFREDYGFTGKESDVEVGLQYFGRRYYAPALNRWVSADPLAIHVPGKADFNLYAYVSGMALKAIDPLGLEGKYGESGPGNTPSDEAPKQEDVGGTQEKPTWLASVVTTVACSTPVGMGVCGAVATPGDSPGPAEQVAPGNRELGESAVGGMAGRGVAMGVRGATAVVRSVGAGAGRTMTKVAPSATQATKSLGRKLDEMYEGIARVLRTGDDVGKATAQGIEQGAREGIAEGIPRVAARETLPAVSRTARLSQEGIEHIALRHFPTSGAPGAGKFATTSLREVRSLIKETVAKGTIRPNTLGRPGNIFELNFGRQIGTNVTGDAATSLRVVVTPEGVVKTAFPF